MGGLPSSMGFRDGISDSVPSCVTLALNTFPNKLQCLPFVPFKPPTPPHSTEPNPRQN